MVAQHGLCRLMGVGLISDPIAYLFFCGITRLFTFFPGTLQPDWSVATTMGEGKHIGFPQTHPKAQRVDSPRSTAMPSRDAEVMAMSQNHILEARSGRGRSRANGLLLISGTPKRGDPTLFTWNLTEKSLRKENGLPGPPCQVPC